MRLELLVGGAKQQVEVSGPLASIGGTDEDTVRVPGAPARLVELRHDGAAWVLRTRVQGRIDGVPFAALIPRVWLPGETLSMGPGLSILHVNDQVAAKAGTAAVAKELLGMAEAPTAAALPVFVCLTGVESGRRFQLVSESAVIGRADDAEVRLRDASVSRRHARVQNVDGQFWLEDLDSPNGVFVNGRRVSRRAPLPDGAVVELGQTLLRFQIPEVAMNAPTPTPINAAPVLLADAEPLALPSAGETEPKLTLVPPPPPEDGEPSPSDDARSPSKNQVVRLSAVARRLRPTFPSMSALEWSLMGLGAAMMIIGALVTWACLG